MTTPPTPPSRSPAAPLPAGLKKHLPLRPRTWRGWLLTAFTLVALILLTTWILARTTPPWYNPLPPDEDWVIDNYDHAQKSMLELHNVTERVPLGEQTWSITQDEINSLLAIQFAPPPDASRSAPPPTPATPPVISSPFILFQPGEVTFCARTTRLASGNPNGGVASATFTVGIVPGPDGKPQGLVRLKSVWAGNLPIPKSAVEPRIRALLPTLMPAITQTIIPLLDPRSAGKTIPEEDLLQFFRALTEGQPFPLQHTLKKKTFIIKDLRVEEGKFTVILAPPAVSPATR